MPWLAVGLAVSFGLYGVVRKVAAVDSMTGLAVETLLILPAAGGTLAYPGRHRTGCGTAASATETAYCCRVVA